MKPQAHPFQPIRRVPAAPIGLANNDNEAEVTDTIIEARGLKRSFKAKGAKGKTIDAVRGIDLSVREGRSSAFWDRTAPARPRRSRCSAPC